MNKNAWKRYEVKCAVCGVTVRKSNPQKTCGMKCRVALARKTAEEAAPLGQCPFCGESKRLSHLAKGVPVCSRRCAVSIWMRLTDEKRRGSKSRARLLGPINSSMSCKTCGQIFKQKKANHIFCSKKCMESWAHHHGVKGRNLRVKKLRLAEARDEAIGSCSLCGVNWRDIKTIRELGSERRLGASRFHMDHIVPKCRGGTETRPLCWFCNLAKLDMDPTTDPAIAAAGRAFWAVINATPASKPTAPVLASTLQPTL